MKQCNCGCGNSVFSNGYSRFCQHKRTDEKYMKAKERQREKHLSSRKPIAKRTTKKSMRKVFWSATSQVDLFNTLWAAAMDNEGRIVCPYTGENIEGYENGSYEMWLSCFAHVLPKGKYPLFKLNPENIRVVNPEFHHIIDQGTKSDRLKHPTWNFAKWDEDVLDMKRQYEEFKRDNLLA